MRYFKLFRFMGVMMVQIKCKLYNAEFSPQTLLRAKKLETKSTTKKQENLKNGKVRFRLNIDVRKEKEDSWPNAMKTKIAFIKGCLKCFQKFSSKITTVADVHLMESLLDNWLKNIMISP